MLDFIKGLSDNPYFSAGFGLGGLAIGTAIVKRGAVFGTILFRRYCMMTLEIPNRDRSYPWVLQWLTEKGAKGIQHMSAVTAYEQWQTGKINTKLSYIPGLGIHVFKYNNYWIRVERSREQAHDLQTGIPWETVTFTTVGRNRQLFFDILEEARTMAMKQFEGKTVTYAARGSEWTEFGHPKMKRPLKSVVLQPGLSQKIVADVQDFLDNQAWYAERGIPYRRGYLLYGPPGCGKSSFITALAAHLDMGISVLNLSDRGLSDDRLYHLLAAAPEHTIILLEDVDAAFVSREDTPEMKTAYQGLNRVTFSGFLNCLDGVVSSEARILFMTTNYRERLDPALTRPGRVDFQAYIGYCEPAQISYLFQNFYPEADATTVQKFSTAVTELKTQLSPAMLQGYFLMFKNDPQGAIQNVSHLKPEPTETAGSTESIERRKA